MRIIRLTKKIISIINKYYKYKSYISTRIYIYKHNINII